MGVQQRPLRLTVVLKDQDGRERGSKSIVVPSRAPLGAVKEMIMQEFNIDPDKNTIALKRSDGRIIEAHEATPIGELVRDGEVLYAEPFSAVAQTHFLEPFIGKVFSMIVADIQKAGLRVFALERFDRILLLIMYGKRRSSYHAILAVVDLLKFPRFPDSVCFYVTPPIDHLCCFSGEDPLNLFYGKYREFMDRFLTKHGLKGYEWCKVHPSEDLVKRIGETPPYAGAFTNIVRYTLLGGSKHGPMFDLILGMKRYRGEDLWR